MVGFESMQEIGHRSGGQVLTENVSTSYTHVQGELQK